MNTMEHFIKIIQRFSLFCALFFFSESITGQSVTFMGVDIDQSYLSFNKSISSKITFESETDFEAKYIGTFAGISNCNIIVHKSSQNRVSSVCVEKMYVDPSVTNRLLASYTSKYGQIYKTYRTGKYNDIIHYCYKVGIHKIMIEVIYYEMNGGFSRFEVIYTPRGYINEGSNVRVNTSDI